MTSRVSKRARQRQVTLPAVSLFLTLMCAVLLIPSPLDAQVSSPVERGQARILVDADLYNAPEDDHVIIRIVNNTDKQLLANIAEQLGQRFHVQPNNVSYEAGDPKYITDKGIGVNFYLPVVPREQGHALPLAPFLEVLAPYVSRVQMLYLIHGNYICNGYESYPNSAVQLKLDKPAGAMQMTFYGLRAEIATTNLPGPPPPSAVRWVHHNKHLLKILGFVLLAGMIGASIGLGLSILLHRWKS